MGKPITMKFLFRLLEKLNHTPQESLNAKIKMAEDVVIKLG